jgi:hypothetical protein
LAAPERHVEGVGDELGAAVIAEAPAQDPAAPGVEHERAVDPAFVGAVLGDVGDPELVRAVDCELVVDEIFGGCLGRVALGAASLASTGDALQACMSHEPLDALAAAANTHADGELGVNSGAAVGASGEGVGFDDQRCQLGISLCSRRGWPALPVVEPGRGQGQQPAAHRDREAVDGEPVHDREDHFGRTFSCAK